MTDMKEKLKARVCNAIDENKDRISEVASALFNMPELSFREYNTSKYVMERFKELSMSGLEDGLAVTGVKGIYHGKQDGGTVAIIGELDAVVCKGHPYADPVTYAAHACGHYMQLTVMIACAIALKQVMPELDGNVVFIGIPAEEGVDSQYKEYLKKEHKNVFFSGKQEFVRLGLMEGIDAALLVHSSPGADAEVSIPCNSNTTKSKNIRIIGKEAHAGGEPHNGINALNCACLIIEAINSVRESFKENDRIRVSPIITNGGISTSTIPGEAELDIGIRARSIDALGETDEKVDRIIKGCAYAMGAKAEVTEYPGYMSMNYAGDEMINVLRHNITRFMPEKDITVAHDCNITTDTGDWSNILPTVQVAMGGGFAGNHHCRDFMPVNNELAYYQPAKIMAMTVVDMLFDNAEALKKIKKEYNQRFTSEEYMQYWSAKDNEPVSI